MHTCPHCGNTNAATIQDNGHEGANLTLLCVKPCEQGETASTDPIPLDDGTYVCGEQWSPYYDDGERGGEDGCSSYRRL